MNPTRKLRQTFGSARRRGLSDADATRLAVTELLAELGLEMLPGENLPSLMFDHAAKALERRRPDKTEGNRHA